MDKNNFNVLFSALIIFCLIFISTPNTYSQNLPLITEEEQQEQGFQASEDDPLQIPVSEDMVTMEAMSRQESLIADLAEAFEALNVEGAETIITVFIGEDFSLEEVVSILKNAGFKTEDVFQALVNTQGDDDLSLLIKPMLEARFDSGDVFKLGIRHLRDEHPEMNDDQIIDSLLGQDAETDQIKALMKEVFMDKIDGISMQAKADLIKAMMNSYFEMGEITNALVENGFSIDQIADIYSNAGIEIGLTYDLLVAVSGPENVQDVVNALMESDYDKNDVFSIVVDKLETSHDLTQIITILIGDISADGPTDQQSNDSIVLGSILSSKSINNQSIVDAFIQAGFTVNDAAVLLNGMGIDVEDAFTYLVNANGGQDVAEVALAMLEQGYDQQTVYQLAVEEMNSQDYSIDVIFTSLIGPIDPVKGATSKQRANAEMLSQILIADEQLVDVASGLLNAGFSLKGSQGAAKIFFDIDVSLEDAYDALINANGGQGIAEVAIAMHDSGYSLEGILDIVLPVMSAQYQPSQIVTMLVGAIAENKSPTSKQKLRAVGLMERLGQSTEALQDISSTLISNGFNLNEVGWCLHKADIALEDAVAVLLDPGTYTVGAVCEALTRGGYDDNAVFTRVIDILSQDHDVQQIFSMVIGQIDPEKGVSSTQIEMAADMITIFVANEEDLTELCSSLIQAGFDVYDAGKALQKAGISASDAFSSLLAAGSGQDIIEVTYSLLDSGYSDEEVIDLAVTAMKGPEYNYDIQTIASSIIGSARSTREKQSLAENLVSVLQDQGDGLPNICSALHQANLSFDELVLIFKKTGISVLDTYQALMSVGGQDNAVEVIKHLLNNDYTLSEIFTAVVPALLEENSTSDIIDILIGGIDPENGPDATQILWANQLSRALNQQGKTGPELAVDFFAAGFTLDQTAVILKTIGEGYEQAYNILIDLGEGQDIAEASWALINAAYEIGEVLELVVPILSANNNMAEVITMLIGDIEVQADENQLMVAYTLADMFHDGTPEKLAEISEVLLSADVTLTQIASITKSLESDINLTYGILKNLGQGQDTSAVAIAMINAQFEAGDVYEIAVPVMLGEMGAADIVAALIGAVDEQEGASSKQIANAAALLKQLDAENIDLALASQGLQAIGFIVSEAAEVFHDAEISASDAFNALVSFEGPENEFELAKEMISEKFNNTEVINAMVEYLVGQSVSVDDIIAMAIGEIDAEQGPTSTQVNFARLIIGGLQEAGKTLSEAAVGLNNAGFELDKIANIFKTSDISIADAYVGLLAACEGDDHQKMKEASSHLNAGGYDGFDVYKHVVDILSGQGITNQSQVINILIGDSDPEDEHQINNAASLAEVFVFNDMKLSVVLNDNGQSMLNLLVEGHDFVRIEQMLLEKGASQDDIDAVFNEHFDMFVQEMTDSGMSAEDIAKGLLTKGNVLDCIRNLGKQLLYNDFKSNEVELALMRANPGPLYYNIYMEIRAGLAEGKDYDITLTEEADYFREHIQAESLIDIVEHFAAEGYTIKFVGLLCEALGQSVQDTFSALEQTRDTFVQEGALDNDGVVIVTLAKIFDQEDVFDTAVEYYKAAGFSPEAIVFRMTTAQANIDADNVLADALVQQHYKNTADLNANAFATIFSAGFSISFIKTALLEKQFTNTQIEDFIQNVDNFAAIYSGMTARNMSMYNMAKVFELEDSPDEYTVLLAQHMKLDGKDDETIKYYLKMHGGDEALIQRGLDRVVE
jgi:hypothetical protein